MILIRGAEVLWAAIENPLFTEMPTPSETQNAGHEAKMPKH